MSLFPVHEGLFRKDAMSIQRMWSYFRIPDSAERAPFARAFRMHWHRHRSSDVSHPRFPTPSASPVVVDDAMHLVAPRRRRRAAAAFARGPCSRMEFSRHRHYKRIVTNLLLSFSLCAARQNGLDHRRRSGITVSSISRLIYLLLRWRVWFASDDTSLGETNVISVNTKPIYSKYVPVMLEERRRQSYQAFPVSANAMRLIHRNYNGFDIYVFFFCFLKAAWIFVFRLRMYTRYMYGFCKSARVFEHSSLLKTQPG